MYDLNVYLNIAQCAAMLGLLVLDRTHNGCFVLSPSTIVHHKDKSVRARLN